MADDYYKLPGGFVLAVEHDTPFPDVSLALTEPNGLIAIGGDLSAKRLLDAYRKGIFPWFSAGEPILWWSPDPRMVLFPDELKVQKSLKKTIQKQPFEIRINTAFKQVMEACSQTPRPDQDGTWINQKMIQAYCQLHEIGHTISVESWQNNQLVGGCYGVRIGRMFYGESMFHHVSNASKVAFVHLVQYLQSQGIGMIDCQMNTPLLASFGAREIPRNTFIDLLSRLVNT
ncbi:MAG TPA: leucyl/phenylalanyl-tRNA--protein transferase [Methylophilaceae bacterium]|nr:leucyl/phenylalanyl-tRNA--protein transferase [Methylophilaceae bacterium]